MSIRGKLAGSMVNWAFLHGQIEAPIWLLFSRALSKTPPWKRLFPFIFCDVAASFFLFYVFGKKKLFLLVAQKEFFPYLGTKLSENNNNNNTSPPCAEVLLYFLHSGK